MTYRYSAFIITHNRVEELQQTIQTLFKQTIPPESILIVDNSDNDESKMLIVQLGNNKLIYKKTGYNAGPAGAAKLALGILFEKGCEWVLWVDDDDPPQFTDTVAALYEIVDGFEAKAKVGMVGAVGARFNKKQSKLIRLKDHELKGVLEVDNVAGNMFPLIHRTVYEQKIFPDPDLFFGFEELDFCLAVRRAGLKILVSGEEHFRHRSAANRLALQTTSYHVKKKEHLWREYYSVRNLLYILLNKERNLRGVFSLCTRTLLKTVYGFYFGISYGKTNGYYLIRGLKDGFTQKMGLTVFPMPKR